MPTAPAGAVAAQKKLVETAPVVRTVGRASTSSANSHASKTGRVWDEIDAQDEWLECGAGHLAAESLVALAMLLADIVPVLSWPELIRVDEAMAATKGTEGTGLFERLRGGCR